MKKINLRKNNLDLSLFLDDEFSLFLQKEGFSLKSDDISFNKYIFIRKENSSFDPLHRLFCVYKNYFGSPVDAVKIQIEDHQILYSITESVLLEQGKKEKWLNATNPKIPKKLALELVRFLFPEMSESNIRTTFTDENQSHQFFIKADSKHLYRDEFIRRVIKRLHTEKSKEVKKDLEELLDFCSQFSYTINKGLKKKNFFLMKSVIEEYHYGKILRDK